MVSYGALFASQVELECVLKIGTHSEAFWRLLADSAAYAHSHSSRDGTL